MTRGLSRFGVRVERRRVADQAGAAGAGMDARRFLQDTDVL